MKRYPLLVAFAIFAITGCQKAKKPDIKSVKPAKVQMLPVETDLATITLTEDARRRLGITTVLVAERVITQRRTLGGQAVVPSGKTIIVSAPLAGVIALIGSDPLPMPGQPVQLGSPLLSIKPLLSAERDVMTPAEQVQLVTARANLMAAQTGAAGDVDRSQAEVAGAEIAFERAKQLFADRAGARRAVDDTEAALNIARSTLEAAQDRNKQLTDLVKMLDVQVSDGEATAIPLTTPISGLVNRIDVSEGQTVSTGATLFEIINTDKIWIRVPVFVDILKNVQVDEPARLTSLSGDSIGDDVMAKPVTAPPTADTMNSSADLYYEVDNRELRLRPGQRIGVELPVSTSASSLIVPNGAILYDIYGGTWVYVMTGDREYTRSRVAIRFVVGEEAVLANGPQMGTSVVVDGAAELFGTEFGAGK